MDELKMNVLFETFEMNVNEKKYIRVIPNTLMQAMVKLLGTWCKEYESLKQTIASCFMQHIDYFYPTPE